MQPEKSFTFNDTVGRDALLQAITDAGDNAILISTIGTTVTWRSHTVQTETVLDTLAQNFEQNVTGTSGASGGGAATLLEDYFVDSDTGDDSNSGADYANAWLTMENLNTVPFGRIHFRGSLDIPSVTIVNGEFIFIRDGAMAGRLGKINISNTKLRLGEAFFDPDEALNLVALNADFNCDVVVNTNHNWQPAGDNVFRVSNNSRCQINEDQTLVGNANRLLFSNLNSQLFMLQGNNFIDGGSATAVQVAFVNNSSFAVLGSAQLGAAFTVTGAPITATNVATVRCVPYGGVFDNDYAGSTVDATSIVEGWLDYPYRAINEEILTEVTSSGAAVMGSLLPVDVSAGAATVTVPANARISNKFSVADSRGNATTFNITVDFVTAGYNFYGASANDVIAADEAVRRYTFISSAIGFIREN